MSITETFFAYAAAFEKAYASDDWSLVEPFFTEDAVYEVPLDPPMGGRFEGRDAILAYFKDVVDRVDRHFETRRPGLLEGPHEEGNSVRVRGNATYAAPGVPDFVLELEEVAYFDGDRIRRLEDRYTPEMKREIAAYAAEHGEKLGINLEA